MSQGIPKSIINILKNNNKNSSTISRGGMVITTGCMVGTRKLNYRKFSNIAIAVCGIKLFTYVNFVEYFYYIIDKYIIKIIDNN